MRFLEHNFLQVGAVAQVETHEIGSPDVDGFERLGAKDIDGPQGVGRKDELFVGAESVSGEGLQLLGILEHLVYDVGLRIEKTLSTCGKH